MWNRAFPPLVTGILGFAIGIAVAVGFGAWDGQPASSEGGEVTPAVEAAAPPARPQSTRPPADSEPGSPPSAPDVDVDALLAEVEFLRRMVDPLAGPPVEWPSVDAYAPDAVRAAAEAAFPGMDVAVDCREFPCVAVIESGDTMPTTLADDLAEHGFPRNAYGRLGDELERAGLEDMQLAVRNGGLDDGGYRILAAWMTSEEDAEVGDRLGARLEYLAEHGAVSAEP